MTNDEDLQMLRSAKDLMDQFEAMERKQVNAKLRVVSLRAELEDLNDRLHNLDTARDAEVMATLYMRIGSIGIELRRLNA